MEQMEQKDRRSYLGGGDAAAIMGLHRWRTPIEVWAIKTGQVVPDGTIGDLVPVRLGMKLEQAVADFFVEETGHRVIPVTKDLCAARNWNYFTHVEDGEERIVLLHPKHDFIGGQPDRILDGLPAGLECKTTTIRKKREWEGEDIPLEAIYQCFHYMAVTGLPIWFIAALIGNEVFDWKALVRDDYDAASLGLPKGKVSIVKAADLNVMITKEVYFWNTFVVPQVMPMTVTADDGGVLFQLYPNAKPETVIELGDDANILVERLDAMQTEYKALEDDIEKQKNELRIMLKDNEKGLTNKYEISWKNQPKNRIDAKRLKAEAPDIYEQYLDKSTMRVFRFKVIK